MIYQSGANVTPHPTAGLSHLITDAERAARILVVDDDVTSLRFITQVLTRAGFQNVRAMNNGARVLDALRDIDPDVVLLDLHMPRVDGIELIGQIGEFAGRRNFLPVLVLTGDCSVAARDAALAAGAKDFLTKPYEPSEVILRVRNLIETRLLHLELRRQNRHLSEDFAARTAELEAAKLELLEILARASDFRDETTHAHTQRVGELSARIAARMGLSDAAIEQLRVAARLHDIGKIGLSDSVLQKSGRLTPMEFRSQERHTLIGADILAGSRFPILRLAEEVALTHHEAWDGSGYPHALSGESIPLSGRIVAVADVFDALTHARPYKNAWTSQAALDEIVKERGHKFDPAVVDAFLDIVDDYVSRESAKRQTISDSETAGLCPEAERARLVRDVLRSSVLR